MPVVDKFTMLTLTVSDMPRAKAFYAEQLGLNVMTDYRRDDDNWWVSLMPPEGGVTITLSTYRTDAKPGTVSVYFATSDITASHQALSDKGAEVSEIQNDLYGPGSGVKWFRLSDPDGNQITLAQG
jgi:predicted enzyme related to lactoylglutathione lyase